MHNSSQNSSFGRRTASTGKGYAPDANGLIYVSFYGPQPANPNYQVISTDYETFAIVYGCEPGYPKPNLWYLSRTPTISNALLAQMQATAKSALPNFDFSTLVPVIQGLSALMPLQPKTDSSNDQTYLIPFWKVIQYKYIKLISQN